MPLTNTEPTGLRYVFQPMFNREGKMIAVECLTRFAHHEPASPQDIERFFSEASESLRARILLEQIELVRQHQQWFRHNEVMVTLNVDESTLHMLHDDFIAECVKTIGCLHFEVNEFSNTLVKRTPTIDALTDKYSFWLDDFGAGYAGFAALTAQPFRFIKTDKNLLWSLLEKKNGQQLMDSLLHYFQANQYQVIVEGIETEAHLQWLENMPWFALQGLLWREQTIEALVASVEK
ncbi:MULTISPECIES: EAL domain-containing protein [Klebsiella]|jgi:FOG: EAL domain|uniref:EAL domain-containing protein n=1 Tax=Klebsiella TaxID=570 RepID=UPI00063CBF3E|nr:EAL domain-containing protein [Klebsiella aerogenes]EIW9479628.1 EAL domain-containing protein [Klebsiella aerogenes]EIW9480773.1 EAL domain-containing protein [Klebsiella aerogenes]EIW9499832.1 EAL domain-containing protein [Klebsiella aerogenes]EIW9500992.1 EAL domain-containing protein [Klebsiella aerogenes]EKM7513239.1 EAL domain-containing protein [Klebsiella aerogenes]